MIIEANLRLEEYMILADTEIEEKVKKKLSQLPPAKRKKAKKTINKVAKKWWPKIQKYGPITFSALIYALNFAFVAMIGYEIYKIVYPIYQVKSIIDVPLDIISDILTDLANNSAITML